MDFQYNSDNISFIEIYLAKDWFLLYLHYPFESEMYLKDIGICLLLIYSFTSYYVTKYKIIKVSESFDIFDLWD